MSSQTYSMGSPGPSPSINRVGAGIALSIVVHLALLFAFKYRAPDAQPDTVPQRTALVLHLRAVPPPPAPLPEPEPVPKASPPTSKAPSQARPVRTRPQAAARSPAIIAMPAAAAEKPPAEPAFTVAPPQEGPAFDPDAARQFARSIATQRDPARAGMAVEQIPDKPLQTETKAARAIASAKRGDCRNAPGGLLAPVLMLLDKKDSGCKW